MLERNSKDSWEDAKELVETTSGNKVERMETVGEHEDGIEIAIDTSTGERISVDLADNQESENETTTDTVVLDTNIPDVDTGLTTNQILLAILGVLRDRNTLAAEHNKKLRDQNKIFKKLLGQVPSSDKTMQGTPPNQNDSNKSTGFPE
jgi:hypothetical protein